MPKIIENLQNDILSESMRIIEETGVDSLNIRGLSANLGIAPSTIYNYYKSKEDIINALIKKRWEESLKKIGKQCFDSSNAVEIFTIIAEELHSSISELMLFHISSSCNKENGSHANHNHQKFIFDQLRAQIEKVLQKQNPPYEDSNFMSFVITKLLIVCMHDKELNLQDISAVMKLL